MQIVVVYLLQESLHRFESVLALLPTLFQTVPINSDIKWRLPTHLLVNQVSDEINVIYSVFMSGVDTNALMIFC